MDWLIFWGAIIIYWVLGIKRMPTYYRRWYEASKKEWTYRTEQEHQRSGAWCALGLASIWPYYEGARWLRDNIIHVLTADERRQKEYEQSRQDSSRLQSAERPGRTRGIRPQTERRISNDTRPQN